MTANWVPTDEQLARFVHDDCSSEESSAIHSWLASSPDHARRLESVRHLVTPQAAIRWNVDGMWSQVRAGTVGAAQPGSLPRMPRRRAPRIAFAGSSWRTPMAASILLGLIGVAGWLGQRSPTPAPVTAVPDVVYQTKRGQTATVQLTDGSRVRLAPDSRLAIPADFGGSLRELTLEGEAEFDVQHDAARPFRVRTSTTVTEDIGTRFSVRAYRGEARVAVAVAEGAVTLARRASSPAPGTQASGVLLRAGELGTLDNTGDVAVSQGAAAHRALAWTKNQLVFVKQPLPDVLATIARWYDLEIRVADPSVAAHLVTAEFTTQSADEMLQALAIAVEATVERHGRRITLRMRP